MAGRPSIPEAVVVEPKGRGVLDAPVKPGHDGGGCGCEAVSATSTLPLLLDVLDVGELDALGTFPGIAEIEFVSRQIDGIAVDVVGIPNHGTLRIGDTLTEGEDFNFVGVPSFAPEIVRRVRLTDAMKAKKLKEALQQMSEEGVVQVFRPRDGAPALVGVVGALQLDVLKARLEAEYSLPVEFEVSEFQLARWVSSDDRKKLDTFLAANTSSIADDVDGDPVYLARNEFYLGYTRERAEGIEFTNVKDVKKKK